MLNYDQRIRLLELATETASNVEDIVPQAERLERFVLNLPEPDQEVESQKRPIQIN